MERIERDTFGHERILCDAERMARLSKPQRVLFGALHEKRRTLAREARVPAFQVMGNATLVHLCEALPLTEEAFALVPGIGRRRQALFGDEFLRLIRRHVLGQGPMDSRSMS